MLVKAAIALEIDDELVITRPDVEALEDAVVLIHLSREIAVHVDRGLFLA